MTGCKPALKLANRLLVPQPLARQRVILPTKYETSVWRSESATQHIVERIKIGAAK
jgi:hypothetical protein